MHQGYTKVVLEALQRNAVMADRNQKHRGLGPAHTKETGNRNATAISEKYRRFRTGNWFPN
jgi:hypothetical protein